MKKKAHTKGAKDAKAEESIGQQLESAFRQAAEANGKPVSLSGSGPGWQWSLQIGSIEVTTK
jgi:hypothetical protein